MYETPNRPPSHENSYDRTRYRSFPFKQTHPDRLATIARPFELETVPVEQCRVLEFAHRLPVQPH